MLSKDNSETTRFGRDESRVKGGSKRETEQNNRQRLRLTSNERFGRYERPCSLRDYCVHMTTEDFDTDTGFETDPDVTGDSLGDPCTPVVLYVSHFK